ncbi:hypothetical protein ASPCADRAFT_2111 [Aspergillus carbonarius ITEM 5010]|uniref:Uncharacterized protein n=1 Tax=Aspergillus carbonarius (strain ITEM 5010) TaxID=602072 RepID=A0A1R3RW11_ASPC5|nr:hypothetical protein ASPCADRAFT_2111 [Aspergillus carbonarius ITEM 5010]
MGRMVGFFTCYGCEHLSSSMAWRTHFTVSAYISFLSSDVVRAWNYLQVSTTYCYELAQEEEFTHQEPDTHPLAPTSSIMARSRWSHGHNPRKTNQPPSSMPSSPSSAFPVSSSVYS